MEKFIKSSKLHDYNSPLLIYSLLPSNLDIMWPYIFKVHISRRWFACVRAKKDTLILEYTFLKLKLF